MTHEKCRKDDKQVSNEGSEKMGEYCRQRDITLAGIRAASTSFWEARTLRRSFIQWQRNFRGKPRVPTPYVAGRRPG